MENCTCNIAQTLKVYSIFSFCLYNFRLMFQFINCLLGFPCKSKIIWKDLSQN